MLDLISACPFTLSISWGWMRGGNVQRDWILLTPQSSPHLWRHSCNSHLVEAGMFWGKMWKSKNQTGRRMWPAAINQKVQVGGHVYKIDWKLARWIKLLRSGTNHYTFSHCNRPLLPVLLSTKKKTHSWTKACKTGGKLALAVSFNISFYGYNRYRYSKISIQSGITEVEGFHLPR